MRKPVTTFLDPEDLEKLEDLSRETGRPLSTIVREAVKRFLKEVSRSEA
jgi:predicted DNA-binding protein